MKQHITFIIVILAGVILSSCQKEISCEDCRENNRPPIAVAGPDKVITLPTDSLLLDGSASSNPDGTINGWLWKKISGPASFNIRTAAASKTIVKVLVAGTYRFELAVTDNGGLSAKERGGVYSFWTYRGKFCFRTITSRDGFVTNNASASRSIIFLS